MAIPPFSQVAESVPFDNATNGFTSDNVQAAIEEISFSNRGSASCGFDGNASSGRWLEFFSNNPSNNTPMIVAEPAWVAALSISSSSNSTGTVELLKNGVAIQTISLAANKKAAVIGLTHPVTTLDELALRVISGSISRPLVFVSIRTLP